MTEMKQVGHTPGPWRYSAEEAGLRGGDYAIVRDYSAQETGDEPRSETVAEVLCASGDVAESDARLIAAAPELLEALRCMVVSVEYWNENRAGFEGFGAAFDQSVAAIAKATGAEA